LNYQVVEEIPSVAHDDDDADEDVSIPSKKKAHIDDGRHAVDERNGDSDGQFDFEEQDDDAISDQNDDDDDELADDDSEDDDDGSAGDDDVESNKGDNDDDHDKTPQADDATRKSKSGNKRVKLSALDPEELAKYNKLAERRWVCIIYVLMLQFGMRAYVSVCMHLYMSAGACVC
jgi:hypothetical protein